MTGDTVSEGSPGSAVEEEAPEEAPEAAAEVEEEKKKGSLSALFDFWLVLVVIILVDTAYRLWAAGTELANPPLQEMEAYLVFWVHDRLGHPVTLREFGNSGYDLVLTFQDSRLQNGRLDYHISDDCTGLHEIVFLAAMILPFRSIPWKKRLWGLGILIPAIFVLNLGRILMLYPLALTLGNSGMWYIHYIIWKYGQLILILLMWMVWFYFAGWKNTVKAMEQLTGKDESEE